MNTVLAETWPYLLLIFAGFLPNEVWRVLGVIFARSIHEDSEILIWVRAVATAVLAGVIGKLILFPAGALTTIPVGIRVAAAGLGLLAFFIARRSVFMGVATGEAALIVGAILFVVP
ncbi:MAG: hypothetical protein QOD40_1087 [Alphaproteobacteria bacterium]|jgi:hypothetical protein|nr:hypothetical protein [Alphaproteobacteria bacterium]